MISSIFRSRTLCSLLELFCSHPDRKFHLREIERQTGRPLGGFYLQLKRMEKEGLLTAEKKGPLKHLSLNPDYPYLDELRSIVLRERRRRILKRELSKLLPLLKKALKPQKIILFGSMAGGRVRPDSDLDLVIIKNNLPKRYWDRVKKIAPFLVDCKVGLDYILRTSEEWAQELKNNPFLRKEVMEKGVIVYDKAA